MGVKLSKRVWKKIADKHIKGTKPGGSLFSVNEPTVKKLIRRTIKEGEKVGDAYIKDFKRPTGTEGQTIVKVPVKQGRIRSAYPLSVPGANAGSGLGALVGVPLIGEVVDFINPLSDVQDIANLLEELRPESFCEFERLEEENPIFFD